MFLFLKKKIEVKNIPDESEIIGTKKKKKKTGTKPKEIEINPEGIPYPFFAQLPEILNNGFMLNITDNDTVFTAGIRNNPETFNENEGEKILLCFNHTENPLFDYEITLKS
jgi:hypothetical protein